MASATAAPFLSSAPPELLQAVLGVSLTGIIVFQPVYSSVAPATIIDLAYAHLNPAAQQMLQLPECPPQSFLTLYPNAAEAGIFAFYRDTFLSGAPGRYNVNYQHDGLDNYFMLAAQRAGDVLVVSFTDTAEQPRTAVEEALRQSRARELEARAEAETQRQRFYDVLMQLPARVATYHGPDHIFSFINPAFRALVASSDVLGRSVREVAPQAVGEEVVSLLDYVYANGEPVKLQELEVSLAALYPDRSEVLFVNSFYLPLRDLQGQISGVLDFSYDVTEQVMARRQVQQLNQQLEARVLERTQALRQAQAEAEAATQRLLRVTESLPSTTFTTDRSGQVVYISPQWYAYTGMLPGTPIDDAWPQLIHPDDLPAVAQEFSSALAEGRSWSYEFRLRGATGQYRWFASQGVPEPLAEAEAAGRARQWFGSNFDIQDLKLAQNALEQKDRRLSEILRQSPAMIATLEGPDHRFAFTNPGYDALVRHRARLGASVAECLPEMVEQGFIALLDNVYRTGQAYIGREVAIELQLPDGEPASYFLDFTYQPLHDEHSISGILAFVVDVTERVRTRQQAEAAQAQLLATAERAAAEREAFYQVFEQTPALVALLRAPGHRFEYVNPAYQALFPGRQLIGLDLTAAVPEAGAQGFVALLDQVYETGETYFGADLPFTIATADGQPGQVTYFSFTYQAYREQGIVAGVSIFAFDVTEQVLARQERAMQQQQLYRLFEEAPAAIAVLAGPELVFEFVNPAYLRLLPARALLGQPLFEVVPELLHTPVGDMLRQVYASGQTQEAQSLLLPLARPTDGQLEDRYFTFIVQSRRDVLGYIDGLVAFAFEVTEQVLARQQVSATNQALTVSNQQLTRANIDLDTFIYTASHDLKAPITNIEGLLYTLRGELPAEAVAGEVPYILNLMQQSVERFKHTIDHLTDVSKLQKSYDEPAHPVLLAPVIEGVRLDLAPLLLQTGGTLDVDVRAVSTLMMSEKNLRSVVFNLLSNALKYHQPGHPPRVRVRARLEATQAVLEVQDNGLGLDLTRETQLFAMFQRLHTHVEGSGVGLYMVKRLVENAGGHITVESTVGAGSTFTVFLPR